MASIAINTWACNVQSLLQGAPVIYVALLHTGQCSSANHGNTFSYYVFLFTAKSPALYKVNRGSQKVKGWKQREALASGNLKNKRWPELKRFRELTSPWDQQPQPWMCHEIFAWLPNVPHIVSVSPLCLCNLHPSISTDLSLPSRGRVLYSSCWTSSGKAATAGECETGCIRRHCYGSRIWHNSELAGNWTL
jgi:hypothetical protein